MDLLSFCNDILNALLARSKQQACPRKREHPTSCLNEDIPISPTTSDMKRNTTPYTSVQYDGNQH